MTSRTVISLVLVAAAAALTACATPTAGSSASPDADADATVVTGTWGDAGAEHLVLEADGSLAGSDGCNRLGGTYTVDADEITVSLGFSTLMACPGVDTWLRDVATATVDGDVLVVRDVDANEIGTLSRSS
ncbi:META domain-containing protein [Microbacterium sp. NPDC089189]|uniref:META domain-containing protein n=1 Tax=Microbacterium sp. NPDC089189 TaxID=3154972 RepID=UPI003442C3BA